MKARNLMVMIEALEDRKLLSAATIAATASVPPNITQSELALLNTFYYQAGVAPVPGNVVAFYPAPADGAVPTSVMIDWGDGTAASAGAYSVTVASTGFPGAILLPAGDAVIIATHTYASAGNYTVTVTGVDESNASPTVLAVSQSQVSAPPASTTTLTTESQPAATTNVFDASSENHPATTGTSSGTLTNVVQPASITTGAGDSQTTTTPVGTTTVGPNGTLDLANSNIESLTLITVDPGGTLIRPTTGVVGSVLTEAWTPKLPSSLTEAPKMVIHWGDGTTTTYQFTSIPQFNAASGTELVADGHTYHKHGKFHPLVVFKEHGKIIDRVTDVLTIEKSG